MISLTIAYGGGWHRVHTRSTRTAEEVAGTWWSVLEFFVRLRRERAHSSVLFSGIRSGGTTWMICQGSCRSVLWTTNSLFDFFVRLGGPETSWSSSLCVGSDYEEVASMHCGRLTSISHAIMWCDNIWMMVARHPQWDPIQTTKKCATCIVHYTSARIPSRAAVCGRLMQSDDGRARPAEWHCFESSFWKFQEQYRGKSFYIFSL